MAEIINQEERKNGKETYMTRGTMHDYCVLGILSAFKKVGIGPRAWRRFDVEATLREWRHVSKFKDQRFTLNEITELMKKQNLHVGVGDNTEQPSFKNFNLLAKTKKSYA